MGSLDNRMAVRGDDPDSAQGAAVVIGADYDPAEALITGCGR